MLYLDSSALVKLVLPEPESEALRALVAVEPARVTSVIAAVETRRAARRASADPAVHERARNVLAAVDLRPVDEAVVDVADRVAPASVRSLDAVHVATALTLEPELSAFVAYDERMLRAARQAGLRVEAPA